MSLLIEQQGPIVRVTLNRPEVRNAFNEELIAELTAWAESVRPFDFAQGRPFDSAQGGPFDSPRVPVPPGPGKAFCAGADLTWMSKLVSYPRDENVAMPARWRQCSGARPAADR